MPIAVYDADHNAARDLLIGPWHQMQSAVALVVATERERSAKAVEALMTAECGPEWGMASNAKRVVIQERNETLRRAARRIRDLKSE